MSRAFHIVLLAILCLTGCEKNVVGEVAREVASGTADEVKPPGVQPVSEAEAKAFAERLLTAAQGSDAEGIERLIDFRVAVRRALTGLKLHETMLEQTTAGVMTGARTAGLVHQLSTIASRGDSLKLLQTRSDDDGRWATVRLILASGGFEHYDFLLSKGDDGRVVAYDVHFMTSGELLSQTMRRSLIAALDLDKGLLERLSERDNELRGHMKDILEAQQKIAAGNAPAAAAIYEGLPDSVRREKFVLLAWVQSVALTGDEARHARALKELLRTFPSDPAATVASIDHYFLKREFDKAIAAIDKVEKTTAPDPYFGLMRTNALIEMKRYDDARKQIERVIAAEPDLLTAHFTLVAILLAQKAHDETAQQLLMMAKQFGLEYDLPAVPDYADFVASPRYARFLQELKGAP